MKKSIITFALLCFTLISFAQQSEEEITFVNKVNGSGNATSAACKKKDYKQAEQVWVDILNAYNQLPQDAGKKYTYLTGSIYYAITCYQSLQGKKKEAVKNFAICYENGWNNYSHALQNKDLDKIRKEKEFINILQKMREDTDYKYILQQATEYKREQQKDTDTLPRFTYMNPNDSNLVHVRQYFKLDSVAGAGNEVSKIKNILTYIHNKIRHDGQHNNPDEMTSIALAEVCKDGSRGLNCRGLAIVLNECYLAMGFKSRLITCMPKKYIDECHAINAVFSNTLNKWLWVDPTNNAYVMDENGNMLGIAEVRERLRSNQPLVLNEDANWNNRSKTIKEEYLDQYMANNLYYVNCSLRSEYGAENKKFNQSDYVALMPTGYMNDMEKGSFIVNDDVWFWQSPYQD